MSIAITIIGGYLGAGKTTLVNHLLQRAGVGSQYGRVAVLVNDFGDVNIDEALISEVSEDTIKLTNGCICCSLVEGLAMALDGLRQLEDPPERLVIETSGVADPTQLAAYAQIPGFHLDAIIVLADAETVRKRARDKYVGDLVRQQLAAADIVGLNKVDLVDTETADDLKRWLQGMIPGAVVVPVANAAIDPEVLFANTTPPRAGVVSDGPANTPPATVHHEQLFESFSWQSDRSLSRAELDRWLAELGDDVVRVKGFVTVSDQPETHLVVQRVGSRVNVHRSDQVLSGFSAELVLIRLKGATESPTWPC